MYPIAQSYCVLHWTVLNILNIILTGRTRLGKAAVSPIGCIGTSLGLCGTQLLNLHLIYLIYFDIYILYNIIYI